MAVTNATVTPGKLVYRKDSSRKFDAYVEVTSGSTTGYATQDVVGNLIKIPLGKTQSGIIHSVRLMTDKINVFSALLVYFFKGQVAEIADNAPFLLPTDEFDGMLKLIGQTSSSISNPGNATVDIGISTGLDIDFVAELDPDCPFEENDGKAEFALYAYILAQSVGTPNSGQKIGLHVHYCGW